MAVSITMDELIAALREAGCDDAEAGFNGMTAAEMAEAWGCSKFLVMKLVHKASKAGLLTHGRKIATDICGRRNSVPAYALAALTKKKARSSESRCPRTGA
jgi:hypothetical protein